jgi:mono/diheme cytochrome c family protein
MDKVDRREFLKLAGIGGVGLASGLGFSATGSSGEPSKPEESGAEIYKGMCAECHGQLKGKPSLLGASFYPPAPQLPGHSTVYSDREVFWIVKHGIRNTAMPAWGRLLSDEKIRKVAAFVKQPVE